MYQSSNSTAYHKSNNETSLSEEDDNKSQDAYSGHTDYEMVSNLKHYALLFSNEWPHILLINSLKRMKILQIFDNLWQLI